MVKKESPVPATFPATAPMSANEALHASVDYLHAFADAGDQVVQSDIDPGLGTDKDASGVEWDTSNVETDDMMTT